ncbi:MAG: hypothetical protein ACE5H3_02825 [Planctomycetota bacterium]
MPTRILPTLFALLLPLSPLLAQGRTDYMNVESPQVKPITVARVGGHDYLLACNTPDNSVEIWDTDETLPQAQRFIKRVPVGLEPVTVRFNPVTSRFYTANFLGDSVSVVELVDQGGVLEVNFEQTAWVGDEPMDVAFLDLGAGHVLYVTLNTASGIGIWDALTMAPVLPRVDLVDPTTSPNRGIKEPRTILIKGTRIYVLGHKGGFDFPGFGFYDFDIFIGDLGGVHQASIANLGTNNFNMAFLSDGQLFVVSGEANNFLPLTTPDVADEPTGFVKTVFYYLPNPDDATPVILRRDLNDVDGNGSPVPKASALAQATDLAVLERVGQAPKVFFTAFGSDRLGVIEPDPNTDPYSWPLRRITIKNLPGSISTLAGPRGLALKDALPAPPVGFSDPGDRLYVLNRVENSVSVIDPNAETLLQTFALKNNPTPAYITRGRPFLYDARISGNGFVSCSSCHDDARTDDLSWRLGDPPNRNPYSLSLTGGLNSKGEADQALEFARNGYPADKLEMVTQSLQGLLDWEVNPEGSSLVTNGPYHWRGDKPVFQAFNEAFVTLLGGDNLGTAEDPKGLTDQQMDEYAEFINSVHYPPNPLEPLDRVYTGELGDPDDESTGSEALRGMKLFHTRPLTICAGRSCVQCHSLPDGSNNRITEVALLPPLLGFTLVTNSQPIETAAMRGLLQKEGLLEKAAGENGTVQISHFSELHNGAVPSLNQFINLFAVDLNGPGSQDLMDVQEFAREFDWGVAPIVGIPLTITQGHLSDPNLGMDFDLAESQARAANSGLVALAWIGGILRGFWFDLTGGTEGYHEEPGGSVIDRASLLALIAGPEDRIVLMGVPLGDERRIASPSGTTTPLGGPTPSEVELQPMVPNTAYAGVPSLRKNWIPVADRKNPGNVLGSPGNHGPGMGGGGGGGLPNPGDQTDPNAFHWNGFTPSVPFAKALRLFQYGLIRDGQASFGVTSLHHEAPRRFRVAGRNIRPGAKLILLVPDDPAGPPNPQGGPNQIRTIRLELPLYATGIFLSDGRQVWESAVETDPFVTYMLLLGGPKAPGVKKASADVFDKIPEPPPAGMFDPLAWNFHHVSVVNEDGTQVDAGWQRLKLQ